jgi:hypothetical protein
MCSAEAHRGTDEYKEGSELVDATKDKAKERGFICGVHA